MDVVMPACNGEKATRRIMRFQPECKVLALSSYTDDQSVQQMLQAGVAGYLTKQSAADELIKAIRTIRAGKGHCFSPDIAATAHRLKQACSNGRAWDKSLTALESQVLKLIAAGLTNRMIAVQLQLSESEVKGCRERVMDKLTIRSIADLTRYAVANGLVPLNEIPAREANGATAAQVPVRLSSAAAHNEGGACLVEEPTPENLAKAIERSVCADDDFSFRLRHGPFGLQQSTPDREHRTYLTRITHREREVIIALAEGLTNKEVAARLRVGVRTIETHRENLKRKLKINNVAGITKFALARGWITIPGQRLAETSERWGVDPIQISSARMEPRPTMPDRALILIVEDNEVDLMLIRRAFAKAKVLNLWG
jgi:two-component system NarL family response regulator